MEVAEVSYHGDDCWAAKLGEKPQAQMQTNDNKNQQIVNLFYASVPLPELYALALSLSRPINFFDISLK